MDTLEHTVETLTRQAGSRFFGKYRGTVTDVDDPDNNGRIKAQVPAVMGETEVGWALPAFAFAGDGHGQVMLPEVGSMVWIEFEAGDVSRPLWTGAWWGSGEVPDDADANVGLLVTAAGNTLAFDDDAGEIRIEDANGGSIVLDSSGVTTKRDSSSVAVTASSVSVNDGAIEVT